MVPEREIRELTRNYRRGLREIGEFPGKKRERKDMKRQLTEHFVERVWEVLKMILVVYVLFVVLAAVALNLAKCLNDYREPAKRKPTVPPNIFRIGATRSGKTMAAARDVYLCAGHCAHVVLDPPGTLVDAVLPPLIADGHKKRILHENVADLDKTLGFEFLSYPSSKEWIEKQRERDLYIDEFTATALWRRGMDNPWEHPWIDEYCRLACRTYLTQKVKLPLFLLPYALKPGCDQFTTFLVNTLDKDVRYELRKLDSNRRDQEQAKPSERILTSMLHSPALMARCQITFDLEKALLDRKIILLSGRGEISETAKRDIFGCVIRKVSQTVRRYFARTGKPLIVRIVIDEALNSRLISTFEIRDLLEGQKMGLSYDILTQVTMDNKEIMNGIYQGCNRLELFRHGSDLLAEEGARQVGVPILDPYSVHHTDEHIRQFVAGFERVWRESYTDHEDNRSTTQSEKERPVYGERKEETDHYWQLKDQLMMVRQSLRTLDVGWRWVYANGKVWNEYVPLLESLSLFGGSKKRVRRFLRRLKEENECYQVPRIFLPKLESQNETRGSSKGSTTQKRWQ